MTRYLSLRVAFLAGFLALAGEARAQVEPIDPGYYYRLTTRWQGSGKALDVVNDGANSNVRLAPSANASGQSWKIVPLGEGYYRLTTQWLGDSRSLEVVNDGKKNTSVRLAPTKNVSGQYWKIVAINDSFFRLTTRWRGDSLSLDIINDANKNRLQLATTRGLSGQYWMLSKIGPVQ